MDLQLGAEYDWQNIAHGIFLIDIFCKKQSLGGYNEN